SRVELAMSIGQHDLSIEAVIAPGPAAAAEDAIVTALDGGRGTRRLQEEAFALLMSMRYGRVLYEEAELAVHALTPALSWVEFVLVTLSQPGYTTSSLLAVARKLLLVGRIPGYRPRTGLGFAIDGLGELVNYIHGDDDLPPD